MTVAWTRFEEPINECGNTSVAAKLS